MVICIISIAHNEHLVKTGRTIGNTAGENSLKDVGWTNKVAQSRTSDKRTERDKG